jgi:hypothetical protein
VVEEANPPKPEFNPAEFDVDAYAVTTDLATVTLAPTAPPTFEEGVAMEAHEEEKVVVSADLAFPLSADEVSNPVMQASLETGFANSLGLAPEKVSITHIDGVSVDSATAQVSVRARTLRGRKLTGTAITFGIESASSSPEQVQMLKDSVVSAATEGSIVANVQKEAASKGVLIQALKEMERTLEPPALAQSTKTVTVYVKAAAGDDDFRDDLVGGAPTPMPGVNIGSGMRNIPGVWPPADHPGSTAIGVGVSATWDASRGGSALDHPFVLEVAAGGDWYQVGDRVNIGVGVKGWSSPAVLEVTEVGSGGELVSLEIVDGGTFDGDGSAEGDYHLTHVENALLMMARVGQQQTSQPAGHHGGSDRRNGLVIMSCAAGLVVIIAAVAVVGKRRGAGVTQVELAHALHGSRSAPLSHSAPILHSAPLLITKNIHALTSAHPTTNCPYHHRYHPTTSSLASPHTCTADCCGNTKGQHPGLIVQRSTQV